MFTVGERTWTRGTVVRALDTGRDISAIRRRLAREIAAQTRRDDTPTAAVRAVIDRVRRERHLLSRDDTDRWLAEHDLTTADLIRWGEGVVARRSLSLDEIDAHLERAPLGPADLAPHQWASFVCTGLYHQRAEELACGAAAWASDPASRARATLRPGALPGPRTLDLARRRFVARAGADDAALAALISRRQFEWIVVEGTRLVFATEDAAAEAARSLHDGRPVDEIHAHAVLGGDAAIDVGSLDGPAQAAFAGAGPGDVLGPVATGPGATVEVWITTGRREPTLDDPLTRRRAAAEHAERTLQAAVTQQVHWHVDA